MKRLLFLLLLCGCSSTGPVQLSPDTYMISKSSAAGAFTDLPRLKVEVIREANAFALNQGKAVERVSTHDTFPTHGFPSFEYVFKLVEKTNSAAVAAPSASH